MNPIKCNKCGTEITFDDKIRSLSGKKIPLNTDGSKHNCPDSQYAKDNGKDKGPIFTTADQVLEEKTIDNARWFIDGVNLRLAHKRIELTIKDKEISS